MSGRGGNSNRGTPWGQGRSFAQVVRDDPNSNANPGAQQSEDQDGFTTVQNNRRNRDPQQQNRGGYTAAPPSNNSHGRGNGPGTGGDRQGYQEPRGRGAPQGNIGHRGDSHSRGRGRGRGRGGTFSSRPPGDQRHGADNRPFSYQGGGGRNTNTEPPSLYKDLHKEVSHAPSQKIRALEDKIISQHKDGSLTKHLQGLKLGENQRTLSLRPNYGNQGRDVDLFANYFEIGGVNDLQLHEYQVHFREDNISLRVRRRLFTLLLLQPPLLNENVATNYVDKIISTKELKCVDFNLRYNEENESVSHVYQLVLAYVRVHRIGEVLEDINSPVGTYDKDERNMAIQAMNMAVARYPNFGRRIQFVGQSRHFFLETGNEKFFLGGGLEARRGFFHSVKTSTGRLLLNLNVSTAAFYRAGRLIQVAEEAVPLHIARKDNREAHRLDRFLRKLRISTTHGKTSRARTITEIALLETGVAAMPSQVKFYWAQGSPPRNVTVSDYFEKQYNVKVIPQQIVVNIGSQANPCYIPAEFCSVLEGQVARQRLRPDQTSAMIKIACRPPGINALDISTRGRELMGIGKPEGPEHKFGIKFAPQLLAVKGKILQPPRLKYQSDQGPHSIDGAWRFAGFTFKQPGILPGRGSIGYLIVNNLRSATGEFKTRLSQTLRQYGINWRDTQAFQIEISEKDSQKEDVFKEAFRQFQQRGVPFVVALFPRHDQLMYSFVKYCGDILTGIPTVCAVEKKHSGVQGLKTDEGTLRNIALKVNLKLGGINHEIESRPEIRNIMQTTMFVGIDVTHPTGTESQANAPSIAAVVANNDPSLGQWPADVVTQEHRKEMLDTNLRNMVLARLRKWKNQRVLPKHIMVYRDGVSESQYQEVLNTELAQIQEAVKIYYEGQTTPKITFLIVGKRHHTRFYPLNRGGQSGTLPNGNVAPGTVVDRYCTMERNFDFFMVSHAGIQGTSRPAHYVVLYNEANFDANTLQAITHDLTYVYGRASRAVSIATPAYYADIVCERGRFYLHSVFNNSMTGRYDADHSPWVENVHSNLEDTMFYI